LRKLKGSGKGKDARAAGTPASHTKKERKKPPNQKTKSLKKTLYFVLPGQERERRAKKTGGLKRTDVKGGGVELRIGWTDKQQKKLGKKREISIFKTITRKGTKRKNKVDTVLERSRGLASRKKE